MSFIAIGVSVLALDSSREVESSGGPIPAATTGVSCKTGHKWGTYGGTSQPRPANGAIAEFYVRCFFNPPDTSNGNAFMTNLGSAWDGSSSRPFLDLCVAPGCGSGGTSFSSVVTDSLKMCSWGNLRRFDGTITRVAGSLSPACGASGPLSMPDNYAEFYFTAPWPAGYLAGVAGSNYYDAGGVWGDVNSFCFGVTGGEGTCNSTTQLGGTVMPMVQAASGSTNAAAYGLVSGGLAWWVSGSSDAYPDTFVGGGSFPPAACEGLGFAIREDGVTLGGSLAGVNADEGKTYVLRVSSIPTTGAAETFTFWFDGDAGGDTVGPTYLGTATAPLAGGIKDFNVTGILVALEDPTPDLGNIRVRCDTTRVSGVMYWDGDTGSSAGIPPLEQLEPGDAATLGECFTFEGMSLTSPASWVRGIGTMLACLGRWAFIPSDEQLDGFMADVELLTADPPLQWVVEGIDYVEGASFSFGTWDAVGPDCITVLGFESCPAEWDDGVSTPTWLVSLMLFGLWTGTLVGIWRFFS